MTKKWDATQIPDLTGKVAIVTGANSGIGLEAAREFARKGAQVWMAARNERNNHVAREQILNEIPNAQVQTHKLDLSDLASVSSFAEQFKASQQPLDILLNNAGIMAHPYALTPDGFERQLGTNHFGHFALTGQLLPALLTAPAARVVMVSSNLHKTGKMDFANLNWEHGGYEKWQAYGRSKLANLLFAFELQRRLQQAGTRAISLGVHPGYSATNLQSLPASGTPILERLMVKWSTMMAQSQAMGALPLLYAATAPGLQGGEYVGPGGFMEMRGYPEVVHAAKSAYNEVDAAALWRASEELTHVHYDALEALPA